MKRRLRACLTLLSGRRHRVLTGVALAASRQAHAQPAGRDDDRDEAPLAPRKWIIYAGHGEWRGKAGGYALQGYGEVYVRHIAGSYSNVVGLPLAETRPPAQGRGLPACLSGIIERGIGETRCGADRGWRDHRGAGPARRGYRRRDQSLEAKLVAIAPRVTVEAGGENFSCPAASAGISEGRALYVEITREALGGQRAVEARPRPRDRQARLARPAARRRPPRHRSRAGIDLLDEARSGLVAFDGGELRIEPTAAMTMIDVDGWLVPDGSRRWRPGPRPARSAASTWADRSGSTSRPSRQGRRSSGRRDPRCLPAPARSSGPR